MNDNNVDTGDQEHTFETARRLIQEMRILFYAIQGSDG